MTVISVNELNKYYGVNHILKGLSFEIYEGEKVGLLGKNGSGKSTLLKILTHIEPYESGNIFVPADMTLEILEQIPVYPEENSAMDVISSAFHKIKSIKNEMTELEASMHSGSESQLLKKYGKLQLEYETLGGYTTDYYVDKVCNGLGITRDLRNTPFGLLSGGEKTRVNLARILLMNPDVLLLDEPTNHLDINAVEWLEEFLTQYKGTVLIISHDRFFLDRTITRIIEIVDGKAAFFEGNYSYYIKEKAERHLSQTLQYVQQQKKLKQLEEAAERMHIWAKSADSPSMHKRAFAIEKRIERIDKIDRPKTDRKIRTEFKENTFAGSNIIQFNSTVKAFGTKTLMNDLNLIIYKNERIAVIGNNGTGKTTFLKLITGELQPDNGMVKIGSSVKYIYIQQEVVFDEAESAVLDIVRNKLVIGEEKARNILASFHFKGDDVFKKVNSLSGGEKSRLKLCMLMQSDCNLLLLDEPTNHLDIPSREWIEEAVSEFNGTLVFVSHDRYFINRFATRVLEFENGHVIDYKGGYKQYSAWKLQKRTEVASDLRKTTKSSSLFSDGRVKSHKPVDIEKTRSIFEERIMKLEDRSRIIEMQMQEAYSDFIQLQELISEKEDLAEEMEKLYKQWYDTI